MGADLGKTFEASDYFWSNPGIKKIGKVCHPESSYPVGKMYRGARSIVTDDEVRACRTILKAFREYKRNTLRRVKREFAK